MLLVRVRVCRHAKPHCLSGSRKLPGRFLSFPGTSFLFVFLSFPALRGGSCFYHFLVLARLAFLSFPGSALGRPSNRHLGTLHTFATFSIRFSSRFLYVSYPGTARGSLSWAQWGARVCIVSWAEWGPLFIVSWSPRPIVLIVS